MPRSVCVRALSNGRIVHSPKHIQIAAALAFDIQQKELLHNNKNSISSSKTNSDSNNNHNKKTERTQRREEIFNDKGIHFTQRQTGRHTHTHPHAQAQTQLESKGDAITFTCLNKYVYIHKCTHTDNGWPHRTWNIVFAHNRHTPQLLHTVMQSDIAAAAAHSLLST